MEIQVIKTTLNDIRDLRAMFLHEGNFQFIYDKCHLYGWAIEYLILMNGSKVGYGSVWEENDNRTEKDSIFEFYVIPPCRKFALQLFQAFQNSSNATIIKCQSNDPLLTNMLYECARDIYAEAILFKDHYTSDLQIPDVTFFHKPQEGNTGYDRPGYCLLHQQEEVAGGGFMLNYNIPYADIYMDVKPQYRQKGFGSLMVQELKKEIYLMGRVPAARCNVSNTASKATLLKAGFAVCGYLLGGQIKATPQ